MKTGNSFGHELEIVQKINEQGHKPLDSAAIILTKGQSFPTSKDTIFLKKVFSIN